MQNNLISTRSYLVRAIRDWVEDNALTPYLLVNANLPDVLVPQQYVKDDRIVLNVSSAAVRDFVLDRKFVSFSARFSGVPQDLYVPIYAVLAVYAKENGKGLYFEEGGDIEPPLPPTDALTPVELVGIKSTGSSKSKSKRPSLKIIK